MAGEAVACCEHSNSISSAMRAVVEWGLFSSKMIVLMHIKAGLHSNPLLYLDRHGCVYILILWKKWIITPLIRQWEENTREKRDVSEREGGGESLLWQTENRPN